MRITLTDDQIKKILSTISTEEIELKLGANWQYWDVEKIQLGFCLIKCVKDVKGE